MFVPIDITPLSCVLQTVSVATRSLGSGIESNSLAYGIIHHALVKLGT